MRGVAFILLLSLIVCTIQDDVDDVTVEVEPDTSSDIVYESPKPSGNYFIAEHFDDPKAFKKRWILSQAKKEGIEENLARYDGVWEVEAPQKEGLRDDLGLVLKSKAKHAAISSKLEKPFTFNQNPLIVQYEVNFQEGQECGGAYIKLLSQGEKPIDLKQFIDKTPYSIMFGPDKCGNDLKLHFIFRHRNPNNGSLEEKHCKKPKERLQETFEDKKPHLYTLILNPDNTFQVKVDHKVVNEGSLLEDFTPAVNPPAEIDDPRDRKPESWDEREKIPDPEAVKPDDWDENAPKQIKDPNAKKPSDWLDDESPTIPDPDAVKPEDWDTDMDGDWEAPLVDNPACESVSGCGKWEPPTIDNPLFKGKWRPPMIDNPNYQGKWRPRRIPNPDYFHDAQPFRMTSIVAVGFELWSMSPSILFDNILITDSIEVANDYAANSFDLKRRKIDADAVTLYGKLMRSINHKPGWWALYFSWCLIPIVGYGIFLYRRVQEESVLTSFLRYSNERPYLYGVYILLIGLPIALIVVFCCGGPSRDPSDESVGDRKKTDSVEPDFVESPPPARSKSDLDQQDAEEDESGGDDDDDDDENDEAEEDRDTTPEEEEKGPRQRKTTRKE